MVLAVGSAKPTESPDGTITNKEAARFNIADDGIVTYTQPVNIHAANPLAHIPTKGTLLPGSFSLRLTSADGERTKANHWEGTFTYMGVKDLNDVTHTISPIDGDSEQPHITTHPKYQTDLEPHANIEDGQFQFFPATGTALTERLTGITSYHVGNLTIRHTIVQALWAGMIPADELFSNNTRIYSNADLNASFPPGTSIEAIPGADDGQGGTIQRDWLLLRPTMEIFGGAVRISRNFVLSGPYGWNSNIYEAATLPTP